MFPLFYETALKSIQEEAHAKEYWEELGTEQAQEVEKPV